MGILCGDFWLWEHRTQGHPAWPQGMTSTCRQSHSHSSEDAAGMERYGLNCIPPSSHIVIPGPSPLGCDCIWSQGRGGGGRVLVQAARHPRKKGKLGQIHARRRRCEDSEGGYRLAEDRGFGRTQASTHLAQFYLGTRRQWSLPRNSWGTWLGQPEQTAGCRCLNIFYCQHPSSSDFHVLRPASAPVPG